MPAHRIIRIDTETGPGKPPLHYWTCETCAAYGQRRGSLNLADAVDYGTVHAQVCADDFDVEVTAVIPERTRTR